MSTDRTVEWLLRTGVAAAFLYPPISAWIHPYAWVGYFPAFVADLSPVSEPTLLHLFGIFEIIIGVSILVGKKIFLPSMVAAAALILIIGFNFSQMDVLFRDVSIALMALALALRHKEATVPLSK